MACAKVSHHDEASARAHVRELKERSIENKKVLNRLDVYHCGCGAWHVGHNKFKGKQYDRPLQHTH